MSLLQRFGGLQPCLSKGGASSWERQGDGHAKCSLVSVKTNGPASSPDPSVPSDLPQRSGITLGGTVALVLLVFGGINWGLVGLAEVNLVEWLLGRSTLPTRLVYVVVGIAAAYCAYRLPRWSRTG